jgi:cytochrome c biogenesis protein CcmG/thiol:disulfide interchange protein DsbE
VLAGLGLFIALLVYGVATKAPDDSIDQSLADGHTPAAPRFELAVLEKGLVPGALADRVGRAAADGRIGLSELRGSPVVLNLWASWCSPCRDEAAALERGWGSWGRQGVVFLGLDIQDLRGDAREFLQEFNVTYPSIRDPEREVASDYGATGIPETYFLSRAGRVVGHVVGAISTEQLQSGVSAARSGQALGKREGGARRKTR